MTALPKVSAVVTTRTKCNDRAAMSRESSIDFAQEIELAARGEGVWGVAHMSVASNLPQLTTRSRTILLAGRLKWTGLLPTPRGTDPQAGEKNNRSFDVYRYTTDSGAVRENRLGCGKVERWANITNVLRIKFFDVRFGLR